jgi:hypothetical protein
MIEIDETMMNAYWREMKKYEAIQADVDRCASRAAQESPHPNIKDMLANLQKKHGKRRVTIFFANVINASFNDGRYSRETKEWAARQAPIPSNPNGINSPERLKPRLFTTNMHPMLVDGFAAHIIRKEREARENRRQSPSR